MEHVKRSKPESSSSNSNTDFTDVMKELKTFQRQLGAQQKRGVGVIPNREWTDEMKKYIRPGDFLAATKNSTQEESEEDTSDIEEGDEEDDEINKDANQEANIDDADDAEEDEAGYTGEDLIRLDEDKAIPVREWLGDEWSNRIKVLHSIEPAAFPSQIVSQPHSWQLSALSKLLFLEQSEFKGGILGDEPGLGKTLAAILLINHTRTERGGPTIVVTVKACLRQWEQELERNLHENCQLRCFVLRMPNIPAAHLLNYDVILTTYQLIQRQHRNLTTFRKAFRAQKIPPSRPHCSLFSSLFEDLNLRPKRLILDEVQFARNTMKPTSRALRALPREATIMMSGTILANRWSDIFGCVAFLEGLPPMNIQTFHQYFGASTKGEKGPSLSRIYRLQKFLMAFTIARPGTLLNLPQKTETDELFTLTEPECERVEFWMQKYEKAKRASIDKPEGRDKESCIGAAIRALQCASHRLMFVEEEGIEDLDFNPIAPNLEPTSGQKYKDFLDKVKIDHNSMDSSRVIAFLRLYKRLRKESRKNKVLIFSIFVQFLDIIEIAMTKFFGKDMVPLRYDGRVSAEERYNIVKTFEEGSINHPLLISAGAGGLGLNLQAANKVIRLEPWWNRNAELQADARAVRQLQTQNVEVFRLVGENSLIDQELLRVQQEKTQLNNTIMSALQRPDNVPPIIPRVFSH